MYIVMMPFCFSWAGSLHHILMVVEFMVVVVILSGGPLGTTKERKVGVELWGRGDRVEGENERMKMVIVGMVMVVMHGRGWC